MGNEWNGPKILSRIERAAVLGVNATMAAAVLHAKQNHRGWRNRTGLAEGSVRIQEFARKLPGEIRGTWGSVNVIYMIWLEIKRGSALRNAADVEYKGLAGRIKRAMR